MQIIGILNVTPDSFSDGGSLTSPQLALALATQMINDGAAIIDVGAESTRPNATPITAEEEWMRLSPVLAELKTELLSIDTRHAETARRCLQHGNVHYLNDVSGMSDPEMLKAALASEASIIVMHSLSVPADKTLVLTTPPTETLLNWIEQKFIQLTTSGITKERIIFDPGIGFGKTPAQSRELIDNAGQLAEACHKLRTKLLYGHSRKSFLGGDIMTRDLETARISAYLKTKSVDYVRVHNVKANFNAINGVHY